MIIWTMRRRARLQAATLPHPVLPAMMLPTPSPAAQAILDLFR